MQQIIITKSERKLELFEDGLLVSSYNVVLGSCPVGHKTAEGDGKTPEGEYRIFVKNDKSKYFLSLGISYPAKKDADKAIESALISDEEFGLIKDAFSDLGRPPQKTELGGEIYIHGGGTDGDWTKAASLSTTPICGNYLTLSRFRLLSRYCHKIFLALAVTSL